MTATVTSLWRYPIKSLGREAVQQVIMTRGQTMPWDRTWAVRHEQSKATDTEWARCMNFLRVASSPSLAAVTATFDEETQTITLRHPGKTRLTASPETEAQKIIAWASPLANADRAQPIDLVRVPGRGMTDSPFPSISIANNASHDAVANYVDTDLSMHRWRSNIWIDGVDAWEEFGWIGKELRLGSAIVTIKQRADRCMNVQANPDTGERDIDVLAALNHFGHQDFSILAEVTEGGEIKVGDPVELVG